MTSVDSLLKTLILYGLEREVEVCDECEQSFLLVDGVCKCGKKLCASCYKWHLESMG
jgi:hypothetical protein